MIQSADFKSCTVKLIEAGIFMCSVLNIVIQTEGTLSQNAKNESQI